MSSRAFFVIKRSLLCVTWRIKLNVGMDNVSSALISRPSAHGFSCISDPQSRVPEDFDLWSSSAWGSRLAMFYLMCGPPSLRDLQCELSFCCVVLHRVGGLQVTRNSSTDYPCNHSATLLCLQLISRISAVHCKLILLAAHALRGEAKMLSTSIFY